MEGEIVSALIGAASGAALGLVGSYFLVIRQERVSRRDQNLRVALQLVRKSENIEDHFLQLGVIVAGAAKRMHESNGTQFGAYLPVLRGFTAGVEFMDDLELTLMAVHGGFGLARDFEELTRAFARSAELAEVFNLIMSEQVMASPTKSGPRRLLIRTGSTSSDREIAERVEMANNHAIAIRTLVEEVCPLAVKFSESLRLKLEEWLRDKRFRRAMSLRTRPARVESNVPSHAAHQSGSSP